MQCPHTVHLEFLTASPLMKFPSSPRADNLANGGHVHMYQDLPDSHG